MTTKCGLDDAVMIAIQQEILKNEDFRWICLLHEREIIELISTTGETCDKNAWRNKIHCNLSCSKMFYVYLFDSN